MEIGKGEIVRHHRPQRRWQEHSAKILSKNHVADDRRVWLHGRVGSLLAVGRDSIGAVGLENIFLNGAILGMMPRGNPGSFSTKSSRFPRSRSFSTPL